MEEWILRFTGGGMDYHARWIKNPEWEAREERIDPPPAWVDELHQATVEKYDR